jgi:hypothetical protein
MDSHPKYGLKIADTPTDDDGVETSSSDFSEKAEGQPAAVQHSQMELEIDRVKRLNGIPRLALDTCQDE